MIEDLMEPALQREANLGALYNINTHNFLSKKIFKKNLSDDVVEVKDVRFSELEFMDSDTLSERLKSLKLHGELKLAVLLGVVKGGIEGEYIKSDKTSNKKLTQHYRLDIRTKLETLDYSDVEEMRKNLVNNYDRNLFKAATHFVSEIQWGAHAIAKLDYNLSELGDDDKVSGEGMLKYTSLELLASAIKAKGGVGYDNKDNKTTKDFTISLKGDFLINVFPKTAEELQVAISKVSECIATQNGGKGRPINYKLTPISQLERIVDFEFNAILKSIDEHTINSMESKFEKVFELEREFSDFLKDLKRNAQIFSRSEIDQAAKDHESFKAKLDTFQKCFKNKIIEIRTNKADESDLQKLMSEFLKGFELKDKIQNYEDLSGKLKHNRLMKKKGFTVLDADQMIDAEFTTEHENCLIFYTNARLKSKNEKIWGDEWKRLIQLKKSDDNFKVFIYDPDLHGQHFNVPQLDCYRDGVRRRFDEEEWEDKDEEEEEEYNSEDDLSDDCENGYDDEDSGFNEDRSCDKEQHNGLDDDDDDDDDE